MGATIINNSIVVSGGLQSFEDIYNDISNPSKFFKSGTYYATELDFYLEDNAVVEDNGITIEFLNSSDQLIQIEKGSTLKLGQRSDDGVVTGFCTLNAPNIKFAYGFGNTNIRNSGNLLLYGATVNIPGFWSFFEGTNHVEIIECKLIGFGRISGTDSILYKSPVSVAHGRYGGISAKGQIAVNYGNDVYSSEITSTGIGNVACAVYHNPLLVGDLTKYNEEYSNYDQLAYIENTTGSFTLTLVDCKINGNRSLVRTSNNNLTYVEKYTYSFYVINSSGSRLNGVNVTITDATGEVVSEGPTDNMGSYETKLTTIRNTPTGVYPSEGTTVNLNPFTITLNSDDVDMSFVLYVDKPYIDVPVAVCSSTVVGGGTCDISTIESMLNTMQTNILNGQTRARVVVTDAITESTDTIITHTTTGAGNTEILTAIETNGNIAVIA